MKSEPQRGGPHFSGCFPRACLLFFLLILTALPAWAHKVTVFAWVEGDKVVTQSKFAGGRIAKGARIEVYDRAGDKLLEGLSDDQGRFAFKASQPEDLKIVLIAGAGHRAEWQVRADEFQAAAKIAPAAVTGEATRVSSEPMPRTEQPVGAVTLTPDELQALVERAVARRLAPVLRRLEQQGDGPALSEIVGGIGYILGLVGLGAYMHSRRKSG